MKQARKRLTSWDRDVQNQLRHPTMRRLVEEELKVLRVGTAIARPRARCC
jgi:hypothetical protein